MTRARKLFMVVRSSEELNAEAVDTWTDSCAAVES